MQISLQSSVKRRQFVLPCRVPPPGRLGRTIGASLRAGKQKCQFACFLRQRHPIQATSVSKPFASPCIFVRETHAYPVFAYRTFPVDRIAIVDPNETEEKSFRGVRLPGYYRCPFPGPIRLITNPSRLLSAVDRSTRVLDYSLTGENEGVITGDSECYCTHATNARNARDAFLLRARQPQFHHCSPFFAAKTTLATFRSMSPRNFTESKSRSVSRVIV